MYLEKLEIQGFKSFAEPTTLLFNRDLTAIVGPNGSGKSNTADAVRWVLGEQSAKTLRGKKSEDVIFAGSDKRNKLGYAEVSLFLNNKDRLADVDYEQIVITRKVERNGESEYLINNNKVRLLDVQLLLAKANFGQRTYSVIGQGMIDSILVSSAAERKEFFDEATGVKQFQIKKNQALNKLNNAKENLDQTSKIISELEPRLNSLTRQVKKLEKREKLEAELKELQSIYYSYLKNNLNKDLQIKRAEHNKAQEELSSINQQLIDLQTRLDKEEKSSSRQDNFQSLQSRLSHGQNELNSLLKEKTILEGRADLKLMSSGQGDIVWLKQRIENLENEINKNKLSLQEKEAKWNISKEELEILEEKRDKVLAEFSKMEEKLLGGNQDLSPEEMTRQLDDILLSQKDLAKTLDTLTSLDEVPKLKQLLQKVTDKISDFVKKIRVSKEEDKKMWQEQFNKMLSSKDNLVAEISEARTASAILENEKNNLQIQISKDKDELEKLVSQKESLQNTDKTIDKNQLENLNKEIEEKKKALDLIAKEIGDFNELEEGKKKTLLDIQKTFRDLQNEFNDKNNKLNELKVDLARLETREEELDNEIAEEFPALAIQEVKDINIAEAKENISRTKNQLSIIGGIDEVVIEEYQEVNERYSFLKEQSEDLLQAIGHLEKIIRDLEEAISDQFDKSFRNINKFFNEYFKKLFNGGKAELILNIQEVKKNKGDSEDEELADEDLDDEEEEISKQYGIEIKATPPGKKLSGINMLSGGEKALTSIALICAIIANNPSPFVVLDEVDAALDEANSIRFSEILDELSSKTQFVAITHNRATMHQAKIIYGVTMGDDGISKLLSMNFEEADEIAA